MVPVGTLNRSKSKRKQNVRLNILSSLMIFYAILFSLIKSYLCTVKDKISDTILILILDGREAPFELTSVIYWSLKF